MLKHNAGLDKKFFHTEKQAEIEETTDISIDISTKYEINDEKINLSTF
uniref:Uncharacterized protein n=1 Tax=Eubacterium plexicaudatum ASF492 TaxID=1235802 RepID=N2A1H0_9FIRM